jgi:uncharacterized protein YwqG
MLSPEAEARLRAQIDRHGLTARADEICRTAEPAYAVLSDDTCSKSVGASYFGGLPDLPVGTPWPTSNVGLLTFVAQIRLLDLPTVPDGFPREGWLYFFTGQPEATGGRHQILYAPPSSKLKPASPPRDGEFDFGVRQVFELQGTDMRLKNVPGNIPFARARVRFEPITSILPADTDADDFDAYHELVSELNQGDSRLFGHPYDRYDDLESNTDFQAGSRLLLQVDSMEPSEDMGWWDNGKLAFFIPAERLSPTDFQGSTAIVVGSG